MYVATHSFAFLPGLIWETLIEIKTSPKPRDKFQMEYKSIMPTDEQLSKPRVDELTSQKNMFKKKWNYAF